MTKFEELVAKLSELFELDKADLDFGIHRIIKTKHKQIAEYLNQRLPAKVKQVLQELAEAEAGESVAEVKRQLLEQLGETAIAEDGSLNPQFAETPLGKRYQAALDASRNAKKVERNEAEVYSHLYEFFSRHYEDGDFVTRRRRAAGRETYAIPYDGEEVLLHWANKDQYYIKSSEDLKDYAFTVPVNPSGDTGRVKFKLSRMDPVENNNKANRIFRLDDHSEILATEETLVVPFHFAEGKKRTKAAEAEWEQSILEALPEDWRPPLAAPDPTYTGSDREGRTILQKHLRNYTKKNASDYFIHKDLGGFLRRELDFYIKNEVMYLDDVDSRPADYLEKELRKIKAIRAVAHDLIDFLAQFEDFQKKLWLKKKFVIETNWCITLDRAPEELYEEIAANDDQRREWVKLFAIDEIKGETLWEKAYSEPLTAEFLKANNKLVLDTAFFPADFKYRLLSFFEHIDAQTDGLLLHSDNFQALNMLQEKYGERVQCVYIDPPYNTDASPIVYKNGYRDSSWLTLLSDRMAFADHLRTSGAIVCVAIDDYEYASLLDAVAGVLPYARLATVVVRSKPQGRPTATGFSTNHEYAVFWGDEKSVVGRLPREGSKAERYPHKDIKGVYSWANFRKTGSDSNRSDRKRSFYPLFVKEAVIRVPKMAWDDGSESWQLLEAPEEGERAVWPIDQDNVEKVWTCSVERAMGELDDMRVVRVDGGGIGIQKKYRPNQEGALPGTWWDSPGYSASESGTNVLKNLFGHKDFDFPKSINLVIDNLRVSRLAPDGSVLDYFAGSGTTAHAVVELNREDGGNRKYLLAEMGDYFDTVLKPRIQKVVYAAEWKDGKPKSRDNGISHCFKYIRLESYEDALNNLELEDRSADLLGLPEDVAEDYLLRYSLDVETRAGLLNLERFEDPFNCTLRICNRETGETEPKAVDLPETFNYLLGLRVRTMRMRDGFLVIEGENPAAEAVLVIWRNVREKDNAALEKFFAESLRIKPADAPYAAIYVNGDTTLDDPQKKILLTEQVFHELMFDARGLQA
jgi:adenine-specific DNA-methyltransferase